MEVRYDSVVEMLNGIWLDEQFVKSVKDEIYRRSIRKEQKSSIELCLEIRLKLIESAHELIRELGGRSFNGSHRNEQAYDSALAFLQMQYELEKTVVHINTNERAPTTRPAQAE